MTALLEVTPEEAHRMREAAVERRHAATDRVDSIARTIACHVVRRPGAAVDTVRVVGDELIIRQAEAHEAWSDWQDARELCGRERMVR